MQRVKILSLAKFCVNINVQELLIQIHLILSFDTELLTISGYNSGTGFGTNFRRGLGLEKRLIKFNTKQLRGNTKNEDIVY